MPQDQSCTPGCRGTPFTPLFLARGGCRYIAWGSGKEVPSLLFNLDDDPNEWNNLAYDAGHASVVSTLEKNLAKVVDYPKVALNVAQYNKDMFTWWINTTNSWESAMHAPGLRWDQSWEAGGAESLAAVHKWMKEPATIVPCRNSTTAWPLHL